MEPFGGGASVLLAKPPAPLEVYNDLDQRLVNYFQVVRNPKLFSRLEAALRLTPCSRSDFNAAKEPADDAVEDARRFAVLSRQSYAGKGREWSYSVPHAHKTKGNAVAHWQAGLEALRPAHERLLRVQVECLDWRTVLRRYDSLGTLVYADPPYLPDTRTSGKYRHELSEADHRDLVRRLLRLRGMVVLSGYKHEVYAPLEDAGWPRVQMKVRTFASDKLAKRTECLWLSPNAQGRHNPSAVNRMAEGARMTHQVRTDATDRRIRRVVQQMIGRGERVSKAEVARRVELSREHVSRAYAHLFR